MMQRRMYVCEMPKKQSSMTFAWIACAINVQGSGRFCQETQFGLA